MKPYFLNFIEEYIQNPDYAGCIGGRVEVYDDDLVYHGWAKEEMRFLTRKVAEFEELRDRLDGEYVDRYELDTLREKLHFQFMDGIQRRGTE